MMASGSDTSVALSTPAVLVKSELLCFISDRSCVLSVDDLIKICSDFYTEDEIMAARQELDNGDHRLPKRKGADKLKSTIEDLVKVVLNPNNQLPKFGAADLSRLPPVSATHCDISVLLSEIQALRSEVRAVNQLKAELDNMKAEVQLLSQSHRPPMATNLVTVGSTAQAQQPAEQNVAVSNVKSFAAVAHDITLDGKDFQLVQRKQPKPKPVKKVVVGASSGNKHVRSVRTVRSVDIFVSRLHPETACNELVDCIQSVKGDLAVDNIVCTQLQSKYESMYSSFHVAVYVDASELKRAIDLFMAPASWPMGVFVKRFFKRKDAAQQ